VHHHHRHLAWRMALQRPCRDAVANKSWVAVWNWLYLAAGSLVAGKNTLGMVLEN
jgi:hypothetical protein